MDTNINTEILRELFELNADNLDIPDAVWHEEEQRYTIFSQRQFAWEVFKVAYNLGTIYGKISELDF